MEKLADQKRAQVIACLVEGMSIASTARITGIQPNTVTRVLEDVGEACSAYHDKVMVNLPCKLLQLDEIWSFVGCHEARKKSVKGDYPGDVWTWTALCADTKLIPSWRIGDRSGATAYAFCAELSERFSGKLQITSDGHHAYPWAVRANFKDVDFAQLVKVYAKGSDGKDYVKRVEKQRVCENPDMEKCSTSYIERSNLMIRMTNKRFARLTNCYSKKLENHAHMLATGLMSYNFCKKHDAIKMTPAQAAGIADHKWSMEEVIEMVNAYHKAKADAEFEAAFEAKWEAKRESRKVVEWARKHPKPIKPSLTPWYLDKDSGGPNPSEKKAGIEYDERQPLDS